MSVADWIAAERQGDQLCLWDMSGQDVITKRICPYDPESKTLPEEVTGFQRGPVVISGLGQDWRPVPATPIDKKFFKSMDKASQLMCPVPGLKQDQPAAVMAGEETRIAGFLSQNADWDGVICLPGAQTVWAHVSAGEVVSFQCFASGQLLAALAPGWSSGDIWDADVFQATMDKVQSRPEALASGLAQVQAETVLTRMPPVARHSKVAGLLIGAELAAAKPYWLGQQVALIGAPAWRALYAMALAHQGVPFVEADGAEMALAGLVAAHAQLSDRL